MTAKLSDVQIWQKVKSANPSLSVCEVGATIGRMWREMSDTNKQHFNDDFALDKVQCSMLRLLPNIVSKLTSFLDSV